MRKTISVPKKEVEEAIEKEKKKPWGKFVEKGHLQLTIYSNVNGKQES